MNSKILLVIFAVAVAIFAVANAKFDFSPAISAGLFLAGNEQKLVYEFDDVEVSYAAKFTVYPTATSVSSWAGEIAAPGEGITITYGIVILKDFDAQKNDWVEAGREEWLKAEGSLGSKIMLSNSVANSFDPELQHIYSSKTQLWTIKKLDGNSIVKDFAEPVYGAYLFRRLRATEMIPTHVCFRAGSNFDDFWAKTSTEDCYSTEERFFKAVGNPEETTGQEPPNAPEAYKPLCPGRLSCLDKQTGDSRGCVVIASFGCENPQDYCFNCREPSQATTATPECVFTGSGCCTVEDPSQCVALPPVACSAGLVPKVTGCVSGQCSAAFECVTPTDSCTDPDGGKAYLIKGSVYGYFNGQAFNYRDYCSGSTLLEYYCSGNQPLSEQFDCTSLNANSTTYFCEAHGSCMAQTPTPTPTPQCFFTGTGCCYVNNPIQCLGVPPYSCGNGLVVNVTGCLGGGCKAAFECIPSSAPTPTPSPTPQPDSCSDSDGGLDYFTQGSVTGYLYQQPYNGTDYCQEGGSQTPTLLVEWYCSDAQTRNTTMKNCADFNTNSSNYTCVSGACLVSS
ncbi:MAG: hypothetical protein V1717_03450 [Candidatus Micrarchaeota archaeon]